MGRSRKKGRNVHGILLLDKPNGLSSNHALQRVRRLFDAIKAGHTGNLDPLATGVLPVCLGEATKISAFLLDADKAYVAECRLGQRTDTADAEGEVIETKPVPALSRRKIEKQLKQFVGEIEQVPPVPLPLSTQRRQPRPAGPMRSQSPLPACHRYPSQRPISRLPCNACQPESPKPLSWSPPPDKSAACRSRGDPVCRYVPPCAHQTAAARAAGPG